MTSTGCPVDGARAMVIDTSALLAILLNEPERRGFNEEIAGAATRLMSSASFLETAIVIETRKGDSGARDLDLFLHQAAIEVVGVDHNQAQIARRAWRSYGKGNHPAGLNFGDCFVYALAKASGEPLLFKGKDFSQTDLEPCG
jgi:ribonuclease VapC